MTTKHNGAFAFSGAEKAELNEIIARYPTKQAATLPALWLAQKSHGWISDDVCTAIADELEVTPAHVKSVAGFYSMYKKQPTGKHFIQVCSTLSCSIMGADHIFDHLSDKLGIGNGGTTENGEFSLLKVECLGSCGTAPMMQINDDYYENLTEEKIEQILGNLE